LTVTHDDAPARRAARQRALQLEWFTVGWTSLEAIIGITAAIRASSIALLGFGADSIIEVASAGVLIWRLRAERTAADPAAIQRLDLRAHRLVAFSLIALAVYIVADAAFALYRREHPHPTVLGMVLTLVTIAVMYVLARAKRRTAAVLESCSLRADSFQATACMWLSAITLAGIGLNALFGWWWADPVAALCMPVFLVQEARKAWQGENCC
jgi:divalent metal cation (Fe/Co/Zn/Cd) transporter